MIKRLILGSAAALVAATGAQAADLPVAEPVEYVRVCDAYGTGFFYIPGTETCLRVGGYVRVEARYVEPVKTELEASSTSGSVYNLSASTNSKYANAASTSTTGIAAHISGGKGETRSNNATTFRARARLNFDARTETEYGTLRSFTRLEFTNTTGSSEDPDVNLARAFIEFAGITAGKVTSFYDFYTGNAIAVDIAPAVSDVTTLAFAYTAAFGNGLTFSLALEDGTERRSNLVSIDTTVRGTGSRGYAGHMMPDIVAALRISQGWGSAQIMGALHEVSALDIGQNGQTADNEYGWAVGAGFELNMPFLNGSTVFAQGAYTEGALSYAVNESRLAGAMVDGIVSSAAGTGVSFDRTKAWSIAGGFSFAFTQNVSFVLEGSWADVDFDKAANASLGSLDWDRWNARGSLFYSPVAGLTMGVGVGYEDLSYDKSMRINGVKPDVDIWEAVFRMQRDF